MDCKSKGQYFTTDLNLLNNIKDFILNSPDEILEPSVGRGDIVKYIKKHIDAKFDMYEIDETLTPLVEGIIYCDFLIKKITKKYKTIIGNPPYIKTNTRNLYIDFIQKCYNLLEANGELIFIVPSEFFKLTSASDLINDMLKSGVFTHIYHPHNEHLFAGASVDVLIFRYCKNSKLSKTSMYNEVSLNLVNSNGVITFVDILPTNKICDYFDAYVGMVSGRDAIYNADIGNIDLLTPNGYKKYIFVDIYPSNDEKINEYLLSNKKELLSRTIKKFNEKNWFEWGAPRNLKMIREHFGLPCIYINTITRNEKVAFIGKVEYFNGSLVLLLPKKDCDLNLICDYINSNNFKNSYMFAGRFKIGQKQVLNAGLNI